MALFAAASLFLGQMASTDALGAAPAATSRAAPLPAREAPTASNAAEGAPATAPAEASPAPEMEIWKDPSFQKAFLGSYGFQAELEPRLTQAEREQLEKVVPLMGTDLPAAAALLEPLCKPEASAIFDFTLGNLEFQQEKLKPAEAHYRAAIAKFPSFRRAWKNLGMVQVRLGEFSPAITSLGRAIELGSGEALTYGLLGYACAAVGQYLSAESAYRNAVLLQPDVIDWKLGLVQSALKQQKFGEVATMCEELIGKHPDRSDYWLLQAAAFIGLNQPMKAAENYEIVQGMGKGTPAMLWTLGDIYVNEGMWEPAGRAYTRAMDAEPDQGLQRALKAAEALAQRGASAQARELLAMVKDANAKSPDPAASRRILRLQAQIAAADGDSEAAAKTLEEMVALDPLDGEALLLLGQSYARKGEPDRAIFWYERAEGIDAFEAEARIRHAQILVARSSYDEALPLLKRAQELKPREDVARYMEQVERFARSKR